jgi:hypothetical protein
MIAVVGWPGHLLVERMVGVIVGVREFHAEIMRQDRDGVKASMLLISGGKGQVLGYHPRVDRRSWSVVARRGVTRFNVFSITCDYCLIM